MGWSYADIDAITLPEAYELFDYWLDYPPVNELMAMQAGWERPKTMEQNLAAGAMGPEDFLHHFKQTGGKLPVN